MKPKFKLSFAKDLSYNVLAVVIMNVVIQFAVYPYLNKMMGEEAFGTVLYLMSIVAIVSNSFGMALNNTRLVIKPKFESKNGDYNTLMLLFCVISSVVALIILYTLNILTLFNGILFCILVIMTLMRYYSDVEYRITLNFKRYFVYYMLLSAGYLGGLLLYHFTGDWYSTLILGETIAVLFVIFRGEIYRKPFECSEKRKTVWRMTMTVAVSYLVSNILMNLDRIVLQNFMGGDAVTIFYTASLLGKTVAILVGPLNGVMIAYLSNYRGEFTRSVFYKVLWGVIGLTAVCYVGCILVSPWLIQLLYPNVYEAASGLINIANLGQVLLFSSTMLTAVILRFCHEKYQFIIVVVYGIIYIALAIPATLWYGIYGFAYATLIANMLRFLFIVIIGTRHSINRRKGGAD